MAQTTATLKQKLEEKEAMLITETNEDTIDAIEDDIYDLKREIAIATYGGLLNAEAIGNFHTKIWLHPGGSAQELAVVDYDANIISGQLTEDQYKWTVNHINLLKQL